MITHLIQTGIPKVTVEALLISLHDVRNSFIGLYLNIFGGKLEVYKSYSHTFNFYFTITLANHVWAWDDDILKFQVIVDISCPMYLF